MKGLETLQELVFDIKTDKKYQDAYYLVLKQLKAFEIIKEHILYCENVDCFVFVNVTKEVNELLKEVLL